MTNHSPLLLSLLGLLLVASPVAATLSLDYTGQPFTTNPNGVGPGPLTGSFEYPTPLMPNSTYGESFFSDWSLQHTNGNNSPVITKANATSIINFEITTNASGDPETWKILVGSTNTSPSCSIPQTYSFAIQNPAEDLNSLLLGVNDAALETYDQSCPQTRVVYSLNQSPGTMNTVPEASSFFYIGLVGLCWALRQKLTPASQQCEDTDLT